MMLDKVKEQIFLNIYYEMVVKMYGLGVRLYFQSSFNIFDCLVSVTVPISMPLPLKCCGADILPMNIHLAFDFY
jgi:hypothetical protein